MKFSVKRIIAGLDVKDGRVVKSIKFVDFQDAGDPLENAAVYSQGGADEICLLDISATVENRKTFTDVIKNVKAAISVPLSVSGGIKELADIERVIGAGAVSVGIGTAAYKNPQLVKDASERFGSRRITIALDVKKHAPGQYTTVIEMGRTDTGADALEWARMCEKNGAGAILLTSLDTDGVRGGYDIQLYKLFSDALNIPVIASGGAGSMEHIREVLAETEVEAAFAASIFHFGIVKIPELKEYLKKHNIRIVGN